MAIIDSVELLFYQIKSLMIANTQINTQGRIKQKGNLRGERNVYDEKHHSNSFDIWFPINVGVDDNNNNGRQNKAALTLS